MGDYGVDMRGWGEGILQQLVLIPVRIVPKHSDEHHIRTTLCVCGGGGGYIGGGERDSLPAVFDPCQDCARTL